jgi:hypothetical protein
MVAEISPSDMFAGHLGIIVAPTFVLGLVPSLDRLILGSAIVAPATGVADKPWSIAQLVDGAYRCAPYADRNPARPTTVIQGGK